MGLIFRVVPWTLTFVFSAGCGTRPKAWLAAWCSKVVCPVVNGSLISDILK